MEADPAAPDDLSFEAYSLTSDSEMSDSGEPVLDLSEEASFPPRSPPLPRSPAPLYSPLTRAAT